MITHWKPDSASEWIEIPEKDEQTFRFMRRFIDWFAYKEKVGRDYGLDEQIVYYDPQRHGFPDLK